MKFRHVLILLVLVFSIAAKPNALLARQSIARSQEFFKPGPDRFVPVHLDFELRSIAKVGGSYVFSIHHKPTGHAKWVGTGEKTEGLSIVEFDETTKSLQVKAEGENYVLWLQGQSASAAGPAAVLASTLAETPAQKESFPRRQRLQVAPRSSPTQLKREPDPARAPEPPGPSSFATARQDEEMSSIEETYPQSGFKEADLPAESERGVTGYRVAPRAVADTNLMR